MLQASHMQLTKPGKHLASLSATALVNLFYHQNDGGEFAITIHSFPTLATSTHAHVHSF